MSTTEEFIGALGTCCKWAGNNDCSLVTFTCNVSITTTTLMTPPPPPLTRRLLLLNKRLMHLRIVPFSQE